ncbi:MAG TPA: serine/threonine-protein kinase [Kineosporiaceae bacterium]
MMAGFDLPGYEDVELIGAGGFGRVYRARQPAFDRTVAVKLLNGRLDDAATLRRFHRECQALGAVAGHPNIVPVYDAGGTPDGQPYLVMDYVRGGSLADRLGRTGPLPCAEVAAIGVKLAGALHTAHAAGVLHRDIKPENILISGYGEPQLADFGIAQRAGIENRTTTAAAMTPSHTAPEQFAGSPPGPATDVYALASTLYTLLAGATPFQGRPEESVYALIARAATEPAPDLRPRGVPDALARVIEAGLAKDPAQRLPSALALGRCLQDAQQSLGVPVTALPVAQDTDPAALGVVAQPPQVTPSPDATRPRPPVPVPPPSSPPVPPPSPAGDTVASAVTAAAPVPGRGQGRGPLMLAAGAVAVALVGLGVVIAVTVVNRTAAGPGPAAPAGSGTASTTGTTPTATDPLPSPVTTSASGTPAGTAAGSAPVSSTGSGLDALLLTAGSTPLEGWSDGADLGQIITPDTAFFCRRTIALAAGTRASTIFTGPDSRILDEHVYRVGPQQAKQAMAELRASASCNTWTGELSGGRMTVSRGDAATVGDDAATYLVSSGVAQTYQVFFRQGGDFTVITLGAVGGAVTPVDRALAAQAAVAAAKKLAAS